jgi:hypothetical protein
MGKFPACVWVELGDNKRRIKSKIKRQNCGIAYADYK